MFPDKNFMGHGNGMGMPHKDAERWGHDPRRREEVNYRDIASRRPSRRSASRSRSPRRMRRSQSRSRSPRPHDRRSSRSPARYRHDRDRDDGNPKYAFANGRSGGYSSRGDIMRIPEDEPWVGKWLPLKLANGVSKRIASM
ncbi:hypothetical protein KEM48_014508 [Puccinia striiformis f. sp. tritici PST-130]|nr:hypothetical protein KEM48_014508 [Puccinia striiformis f. sp. tritici PST-130]